jgi:hypothetical protein
MNTKHCEQLKQAALQIPWAGSCRRGNIGCLAACVEKTTHTAENTARNILSLIQLNLFYCELIFLFLFSSLKERSFISLFDPVWIFLVHLYWYCVAILRRYNFDPLWDYSSTVLFLSLVLL